MTSPFLPASRTAMAAGLSCLLLAGTALADPRGGPDDNRGPNPGQPTAAAPQKAPPQQQQQRGNAPEARRNQTDQGRPQVAQRDRNDHWDNDHRGNDRRDNNRNAWNDRNNHRRSPDVVVTVGSPAYYTRPAPRYVYNTPRPYYRAPYQQYYYSSYYTERAIPVVTTQPYVEVRCGSQPITGTIVGGVAGGLIGNQFGHHGGNVAATIGGAILGAALGQSFDRADESCAYQAMEYAQPNTQVVWADPNANYSYTVTPGPVSTSEDGRYCREYQAKVLVGNQLQDGYGRACRQPDGSWEVIN